MDPTIGTIRITHKLGFPRHDIYICSLTEVLACLTMYCRYIVFTANVSDALARASTLVFITRCVYLQIHQTRTITESFRNQDAHIIVVLSLTVSEITSVPVFMAIVIYG